MLTADHDKALTYRKPTAEAVITHEAVRAAAKQLASIYDELCPPSREASLAFTAVQESLLWANAAIAIHTHTNESE